jgi:hypothetical protein
MTDKIKFEDLPEWLRDIWAEQPGLARVIEKEYQLLKDNQNEMLQALITIYSNSLQGRREMKWLIPIIEKNANKKIDEVLEI